MKRLFRLITWLSVGALLGLLLAPRPGREMRSELRARAASGGYREVLSGLAEMGSEIGAELGSEVGSMGSSTDQPHGHEDDEAVRAKIEETRARIREEVERQTEG